MNEVKEHKAEREREKQEKDGMFNKLEAHMDKWRKMEAERGSREAEIKIKMESKIVQVECETKMEARRTSIEAKSDG